jgi:hypothetical protein
MVLVVSQVLGSNLLAFGTSEKAAVALRLQDIEERLTQHECLDMYLDNTMAGVPETAICYHDKGVVQSYQVREDGPELRS